MSVLVYYAKLNGFNGILMVDGKYFRKLEERAKGNLSRNLPFGKSKISKKSGPGEKFDKTLVLRGFVHCDPSKFVF